jgi:hypothetical protein
MNLSSRCASFEQNISFWCKNEMEIKKSVLKKKAYMLLFENEIEKINLQKLSKLYCKVSLSVHCACGNIKVATGGPVCGRT